MINLDNTFRPILTVQEFEKKSLKGKAELVTYKKNTYKRSCQSEGLCHLVAIYPLLDSILLKWYKLPQKFKYLQI